MGTLFRNKEALEMVDTGIYTFGAQEQQGAMIDNFSTTLYEKYNAVRAANQAGDAQANAWDLTRPTMSPEQMVDSMRQKEEFQHSQSIPERNRTLVLLAGVAVLGVLAYSMTVKKEQNSVGAMRF